MPEQVNTNRVVLSTAEASKIAGVDPTYIQRLLRQERIEGIRVGTVWLVYEDSLKAFMAQPRKRGPKGPRKKLAHPQISPTPDSRLAGIEHSKEEIAHEDGKETKASE